MKDLTLRAPARARRGVPRRAAARLLWSRPTGGTPSPICGELVAWSATDAARAARRPPREGRVLGLRDGRRARRGLARAGLRGEGARPTRTTSAASATSSSTRARCGPAFGSHNLRSIAYAIAVRPRARAARRGDRAPAPLRHGRAGSRGAPPPRASACASTRRSAISSPAWRTSCAACSRTRRTSRSSGSASPRDRRSRRSIAPPAAERLPRAGRERPSAPPTDAAHPARSRTSRTPSSAARRRATRLAPRWPRRRPRSASPRRS